MTIADQSGTAELDLWQEYVGVVTTGKSYVIRNAMAKFYNEQFRLTTPKSGLIIEHAQELTGITAVVKNKPNRSEPNVSYICSRYYRVPKLIFGATDYTCDIGRFSNHLGFCQRVKKGGWSIPLFYPNILRKEAKVIAV